MSSVLRTESGFFEIEFLFSRDNSARRSYGDAKFSEFSFPRDENWITRGNEIFIPNGTNFTRSDTCARLYVGYCVRSLFFLFFLLLVRRCQDFRSERQRKYMEPISLDKLVRPARRGKSSERFWYSACETSARIRCSQRSYGGEATIEGRLFSPAMVFVRMHAANLPKDR